MTVFLLVTAFLLFLADTFEEYWHIEFNPNDVTIFFGKRR